MYFIIQMIEINYQRLMIDKSAFQNLPEDLRHFIDSPDGLNRDLAVINGFGFSSISPCSAKPNLIELCSFGRPSEDFRLIWYYDIASRDYKMLQTSYPVSTEALSEEDIWVTLRKATSLAQFLEYLDTFRRTDY